MLRLRDANGDDLSLLRALLLEAAFWRADVARPSIEQVLTDPELARYVEGFGRAGDFGLVAVEGAQPRGAAWWRYFRATAPGYGFVDDATPEVTVAVFPTHRGQGIGTALLTALTEVARGRTIGSSALAWSATTPRPLSTRGLAFGRLRVREAP